MKKLLKKSFLVFLAMLLTLSMVACTADKDGGFDDDDDDAGQKNDGNKGKISFSVSYNDTVIELGKPAAAVLSSLGEPDAKQEAFDCGEGNSRMYYQFASFDLYTMKMDGNEVIDELALYDDLAQTAENISVGMSEAEVRSAYGNPMSEENGTLSYASGDDYLSFDIENGKVSAIGLLRKTN